MIQDDPYDNLNTQQRLAVESSAAYTLVLAGAGSGKTRVLIHRIYHIVHVHQVPAYRILAVTFTNKAAQEMRKRLDEQLGPDAMGIWMGTFHSLCHRILRTHAEAAGLPPHFQIIDTDDQLRIIKRLMKKMAIEEDYMPAKQALAFIAKQKEAGKRFAHLPPARDLFGQTVYALYEGYEADLKRAGQVDFADLLLLTQELWNTHPEILQRYHDQFQHVLVDEFQDTNSLQYTWLKTLSRHGLFAVGDDDQSIYGWRGAQVRNLTMFQTDFPEAVVIKLEQNYRSSHTILQASNALIAHNTDRFGKALWTQSGQGEPIAVYDARSDLEEARFVAEKIAHLHQQGHPLSGCAILYRSNAQSRLLEEALLHAHIPYRIFGGLRFFERAEIKDILAYLRVVIHPEDDAACERIINWPTRGIGEQSLVALRQAAHHANRSLMATLTDWIEDADNEVPEDLGTRARQALTKFMELIASLRAVAQSQPLSTTLQEIGQRTGLIAQFEKSKDGRGADRLENVAELIEAAREFEVTEEGEAREPLQQAELFLAHAVLEAGEHQAAAAEDAVHLMTMHAAKGLEFETVFLVGMEEGLFPHQMALQDNNLSEERRLCYVAMTRAKSRLFWCYAMVRRLYGNEKYNAPSRFLRELPPECIQTVRATGTASRATSSSRRGMGGYAANAGEQPAYCLGARVAHPTFGEGVIIDSQGSGADQRLLIAFSVGQKWLMASRAPLKALAY